MATISTAASPANGVNVTGTNYRGPFSIMTSLFFLWGFMTNNFLLSDSSFTLFAFYTFKQGKIAIQWPCP
jgi:fucose permease